MAHTLRSLQATPSNNFRGSDDSAAGKQAHTLTLLGVHSHAAPMPVCDKQQRGADKRRKGDS